LYINFVITGEYRIYEKIEMCEYLLYLIQFVFAPSPVHPGRVYCEKGRGDLVMET
jgi:hypothetical protein